MVYGQVAAAVTDLPWMQLRIRDKIMPADGEDRQVIEILDDGKPIGRLSGWTSVAQEICVNRLTKVTIEAFSSVSETTTR